MVQALDLTLKVNDDYMEMTHNVFIKHQQFHGSQIACIEWVKCVINGRIDIQSPCQTIFDEAYVQSLLRKQKFEIKCDGLNIFPTSSFELHNLIYKI